MAKRKRRVEAATDIDDILDQVLTEAEKCDGVPDIKKICRELEIYYADFRAASAAAADNEDEAYIERYKAIFGRRPMRSRNGVADEVPGEEEVEHFAAGEEEEGDEVDALYTVIRALKPFKSNVRAQIMKAATAMIEVRG